MLETVDCPECGRECRSGTGLASHLRSMHPNVRPTVTADDAPEPVGELIWEDPPTRAADFERDFTPSIIQLRRNPGRWARVHTYTGRTTAGTMVKKFRDAFKDCEFRGAKLRDAEGSAVWGRFVEDE